MPTIVSDLGGLEHLSWVVTAYILASTASIPLWGELGDQYGRNGLFLAANGTASTTRAPSSSPPPPPAWSCRWCTASPPRSRACTCGPWSRAC
ncbi:hypothetical protein [Spongiactinospora sp. TRM90649]|uniref:hypothetical protein n=1 Tax=Spongiactinospora sp. TRM90649 TaxID=3031114 RepID=UPI0023F6C870|nr:hypothetical protein [Spongiactinospora sp. TRM90649]MDF5757616.1 hypothetical protein [Spongiactinospora sp. TRM90649]